ncbi:MAG: EexN family lipoprotein [Gammaproteobacteria bacterium]
MKILNYCLGLGFVLLISSCKSQPPTYEYLMQHPSLLQDEYTHCQADVYGPNCDMVKKAARDFLQLVSERSDNPEGFGKQIIQLQTELAQKPKSDETQQKLQTLYAVVAATSSE